jgi:hypothetical protein
MPAKAPHAAIRRVGLIFATCLLLPAGGLAAAGPASVARAAVPSSTLPKAFRSGSVAAAGPHDLYVLGTVHKHSVVMHRHDGLWSRWAAPNDASVLDVQSATDIWVAGERFTHHKPAPFIAQRVGGKWKTATLPALFKGVYETSEAGGVTSISASSPTDVWAIGNLYDKHTKSAVALHWDGAHWTAVPLPYTGITAPVSVSASSPTNAWMVSLNEVLQWDGKTWSINKTINGSRWLSSVATSGTDCVWAVGGGAPGAIALRYDGAAWTRVQAPHPHGGPATFGTVSLSGCTAWISGQSETKAPPEREGISYALVERSTATGLAVVPVSKARKRGWLNSIAALSSTSAEVAGPLRHRSGLLTVHAA